jgi:hypothetical protein
MPTSREDIREWLNRMHVDGYTHMIVAYDSWDREDFPIYISKGQDVRKREAQISKELKVMEVYSAKLTDEEQLAQHRAFNYD